jgi:hypothetical protein
MIGGALLEIDGFFGLCPSMCGKAPLFREVLKTQAATPPISI